jgi:hypothetical protein
VPEHGMVRIVLGRNTTARAVYRLSIFEFLG